MFLRLMSRKCRRSAGEMLVLEEDGLQVALDGGKGASEVVGDVGNQLFSHALGFAQLVHVRFNCGRHLVEGFAQTGKLVPAANVHAPPAISLLEGAHGLAQRPQRPREEKEQGEADDES